LRNIDFFDSLRGQHKGLTNKINEMREAKSQELFPLEKEKNHLLLSIEENKAEISQLLDKRSAKSLEKEKLAFAVAQERTTLTEKLQQLMQREVRLL